MIKPAGSGPLSQIPESSKIQAEERPTTSSEGAKVVSENKTPVSASHKASQMAEQFIGGEVWSARLNSQLGAIGAGASTQQSDSLKNGSTGPEVKRFQHDLNEWRTRNGMQPIGEDGTFGDQTEAALREFQRASGLEADGVAGVNTKIRLGIENSPNFQGLDSESQQQLRGLSIAGQNNPAIRGRLWEFVEAGGLNELSEAHRHQVIKAFGENPDDGMRMVQVYGNDTFQRMDETTQAQALNMATKNTGNEQYMKDLGMLMATKEFIDLPNHEKQKALNDFEISHSPMAKYPEYQALDEGTKKQLGDLYLKWKYDEPDKASSLSLFVAEGGLEGLSEAHRQQVVKAVEENPFDARRMVQVYGNDTFQRMDETTQAQALNMATKNTGNEQYMKDLGMLIATKEFIDLPNNEKQKALDDFDKSHTLIL